MKGLPLLAADRQQSNLSLRVVERSYFGFPGPLVYFPAFQHSIVSKAAIFIDG